MNIIFFCVFFIFKIILYLHKQFGSENKTIHIYFFLQEKNILKTHTNNIYKYIILLLNCRKKKAMNNKHLYNCNYYSQLNNYLDNINKKYRKK